MGLIVLDAGVLIGVLDRDDAHHLPSTAALRAAEENSDRLVLPVSALAEILVGPTRRGPEAVALVDRLIAALAIDLVAVDEPVAREAALLRAGSGLRLPDALVVATAIVIRADRLLTTDARWRKAVSARFAGTIEIVGS
jgi:predicted nucleic acid-binding protein